MTSKKPGIVYKVFLTFLVKGQGASFSALFGGGLTVMIADPLSQPVVVYITVIGIAVAGGLVGYLNKVPQKTWGQVGLVAFTSGFVGFMTLCVSAMKGYSVAETLFYSGVAGLMGKRVLSDLEQILKHRLGLDKFKERKGGE